MTIAEKIIFIVDKMKYMIDAGKQAEREAFWSNFFKNGVFGGMFAGGGWNIETFKPVYPAEKIQIKSRYVADRLFYNFNRPGTTLSTPVDLAEFCEHADFSQCPYADSIFTDARAKNITIDLGNSTALYRTFAGGNGGWLENITVKVTELCISFFNPFLYQTDMREVRFTEDSTIAANITFAQSSMLSTESIDSIINALQDRTGQTTLTLSLHTNVVSRLTEEQWAIIDAKNWTVG